jgi:CoA-transferase family III
VSAWAASGAAALTGRPEGPPLQPPDAVVERVTALVGEASLPLLGERAALAGLGRQGDISCGGATRLLPAVDGWVAVCLARPEDIAAVPAWLESEVDEPWDAVARALAVRPGAAMVERAQLLGIPASMVPQDRPDVASPVSCRPMGPGPPLVAPPLVVDLSVLWAGPLATNLLGLAGARVVKVESTGRPDGARRDPSGFFDLLNHGKASVALDLGERDGVDRLRDLLRAADVVVESSRPRALRHLGIEAEALLAEDDGPRVWVSVTGHGREGPSANWVGFGDDAAAAGGLVVWDPRGPCFVADAVADPLAGTVAAAAVTRLLAGGGRWLLDVALARVTGWVAGPPTQATVIAGPVAPPRARPLPGRAPALGADTTAVLAELG